MVYPLWLSNEAGDVRVSRYFNVSHVVISFFIVENVGVLLSGLFPYNRSCYLPTPAKSFHSLWWMPEPPWQCFQKGSVPWWTSWGRCWDHQNQSTDDALVGPKSPALNISLVWAELNHEILSGRTHHTIDYSPKESRCSQMIQLG